MKRIIGIFLIIIILLAVATASVASTQSTGTQVKNEVTDFRKDETVYASLSLDGSIEKISIVNRVGAASEGTYTDYGRYSGVKNLTSEASPKIEDNKVIWDLPASSKGFYYEGTLENGELPVLLTAKYLLNGNPIEAKDLAGKSGKITIDLKVTSNPKANAYYIDNYLTQVQLPLSLDKCSNISAEGAQSVIVGSTDTLAFMVMPGTSKEYTVTFDAAEFEMDGITATMMPVDIQGLIGVDLSEIKTGSSDIKKGTNELVNGTTKLKNGVTEIANGLKETASGFAAIVIANAEFKNGLETYLGGVDSVAANADKLSKGLLQLDQNSAALREGYSQLSDGTIKLMEGLLAGMPPEQQALYSVQIDMLKAQIGTFGSNLGAYTQGVSQSSQGLAALSGGLSGLAQQGPSLINGADRIGNGMIQIRDALNSLYKGLSLLPGEIQKLNDGQKELKEGLEEALAKFDEFNINTGKPGNPVSFADSSRKVNSVQFVLKTPELKIPEKKQEPTAAEKPMNFWERLGSLFAK